jgi:predicted nuclease of predicted toxin-antitoxin system
MRILLDESLPSRLAAMLVGHQATAVQGRAWASLKKGKYRMADLAPLVPAILQAIEVMAPRTLRRVTG